MALSDHALTTVSRAKTYLHIDQSDTEEDEWLEIIIPVVSAAFESYCARHFELQTRIDEPYVGTGRQYLVLMHRPIVALQSVTALGGQITDYRSPTPEESEAGMVFRQYGWNTGVLTIGHGLDIGDPHPVYRYDSLNVSYVAGYVTPGQDPSMSTVTLPADLEGASWFEIDRLYNQRLARGIKSQITPVGHTEVYTANTINEDVKQILDAYKNILN